MNIRFHRLSIKLILLSIFSGITIFSGCNKETNKDDVDNLISNPIITEEHFPISDFFLEKGSDSDTSYKSFRGTAINKDSMRLDFTAWGIIETGLFLMRTNRIKEIQFEFMGYCGTIFTRTWQKVTFSEWLTSAEADTIMTISFFRYPDTLSLNVDTLRLIVER